MNEHTTAAEKLEQQKTEMVDLLKMLAEYPTSSHFAHSIHPEDMARIKDLLAKVE